MARRDARAGRVRLGLEPQDEPAVERAWHASRAYVPIDVAAESLAEAAEWLSAAA